MTLDASPQALIQLRSVSRVVSGSKEKTKQVLNDVNWTLFPGQRVGVLAASLREAHAFLDCASGVVPVQQGEVAINANVSWPLGMRGGLMSSLTGRQNASFLQGIYGHSGERRRDLDTIQMLSDLEEGFFDKPLKVYNKFMRARFYLAVALAFDFDVYVIPKLFAWKAQVSSNRLLRLQEALQERTDGKSILMANTDFQFLQQYCNDGIVLNEGTIAFTGSFQECQAWYDAHISNDPVGEDLDEELAEDDPTSASDKEYSEASPEDDLW